MAATSGSGRKCSQPGCRAWAMRGSMTCVAHRNDADGRTMTEDDPASCFAELVRTGKHADLIESTIQAAIDAAAVEPSLSLELGALRLMLKRVVATELLSGDTRETTQTITRLVETTIRTLRMQKTLATGFEDELRAAISRAFADLELLEEA